ncbi:MAG TPA: aminopeptidase [Cyclobacteriaceae bacterium]|nr:aminopeptidase [Cyclobacteriaceae bacterium]
MKSRKRRVLLAVLVVLLVAIIYYWGLILYGIGQGLGQLHIVRNARPVEEFIKDPAFPDSLKQKLYLIDEIRKFAIDSLGLKDTENYKTLFDQRGEEVMWVVTACEAFHFRPKTWDFPVVGTVPYKGYFNKEKAMTEAKKLKEEGWDVAVRNPGGWSTLGWFTDPILTGMLNRNDGDLASLIIHEMVHATLWVPDSVTFNENLASFIADTASYDFLAAKYGRTSPEYEKYLYEDQDYRQFSAFILRAATHLDSLYESMGDAMPAEEKKKRKEEEIKRIVVNMDTLHLRLNPTPSKRYKDRLPNNTYFMLYRNYQEKQPMFKEEFGNKFHGDLKSYIKYLSEKYPVL